MTRFIPKLFSAILFTALAPLTMGLGNPDYDPATGTLKLSAVDFNGVKRYTNVELKLNMATGTFVITKATPADIRIPDVPVQEVTKSGLKVGIRGCLATGQSVICQVILTSIDFNVSVRLAGTTTSSNLETSVFDNKGNTYKPSAITFSNTNGTGYLEKTLIANVPTAATITMENVSTSATSFSSLIFKISSGDTGRTIAEYEFKNIPF